MSGTPCGICTRLVGDRLAICDICTAALVKALLAIPGLLADLDTARSGQARIVADRAGGKSTAVPLPIADTTNEERGYGVRLLGEREVRAASTALHGWARILADHLGVRIPIDAPSLAVLAVNARHAGGATDGAAIVIEHRLRKGEHIRVSHIARRADVHLIPSVRDDERLAVWLASHPRELRQLDAAEAAHQDIVGAVTRLQRMVDRPADRRYLGRCPVVLEDFSKCGANLWAEPDAAWVRCANCRVQLEVCDLEDQATAAAREMLCTMPELLHACAAIGSPIARRTGFRWAAEGRIERRAWLIRRGATVRITDRHEDGAVPVYRVGDALDLARRQPIEEGSTA